MLWLVATGRGRRRAVGAMVGVYSLQELIAHELPWWFAERYKLDVIDNTETVLASKSKVAAKGKKSSLKK